MGCKGSKNARDESIGYTESGPQQGRGAAPRNPQQIPREPDLGNPKPGPGGPKRATFEESYQLGKELGHGSFSTVREGTSKSDGKRFAVKCVKRADLPPEDEEDLKMEVKLLQEMDHENIVKLYAFFEEKHFYYLVMEILNGGELFDRIVLKQFYNEKEARDVLLVLLHAVQYCHVRDVAHRDLKPENLLLVSEEDDAAIKLADFGFARPVGTQGLSTQCGTPGYVAPEILKGERYGKPVDMWSIGVIMYILLGGYPPFHDDNQAKLYQKIKKGKVSFHPQYWTSVSDEAKDLIKRLLTMDTEKRVTAGEALKHPWIVGDAAELAKRDLGKNMDKLRLFNARRKFKSAISSVIAAQNMSSMAEAMGMDRSERPAPTQAPEAAAAAVAADTAPVSAAGENGSGGGDSGASEVAVAQPSAEAVAKAGVVAAAEAAAVVPPSGEEGPAEADE